MYSTNKRTLFLSLATLSIIVIGVLGFGMYKTIQLSLVNDSIDNYLKAFNDSNFIKSFLFSINIALISAFLSVILGVLLALYLWLSNNAFIIKLVNYLALIIPHLMVALLVIIIFSQTGLLSKLFYYLGFISSPDQFKAITYSTSGIDIILAYTYKGTFFVSLVVLDILRSINYKKIQLALSLSASKFQIFKSIIFFKIIKPCLYLFLILFIYALSSYEIPSVLAHSNLKALPVYSYYHYTNNLLDSKSYAMAINVIIVITSLAVSSLIVFLVKKLERKYNL